MHLYIREICTFLNVEEKAPTGKWSWIHRPDRISNGMRPLRGM